MKEYQEKVVTTTTKELTSVICNCCGKEIIKNRLNDYLSIDKQWGYESPWDTDTHKFDICENCYSKWISSFKIPITVEEMY